jgi:cyclophilin family peptidyl-prolyl cis-trans isomerase
LFYCAVATAAADDLDSKADPVIEAVDGFIAELALDKSDEEWKSKVPAPGVMAAFDPEKTYYWNLETNKGDLKIELFHKSAPLHVLSTIYLTRLGFYDDTKFHRIVTDFVVQGGDPTGTGNGGPGYRYPGEFDSDLSHNKKGIVSMANSGPGTDGSQFFITCAPAKRLNGKHTIFGQLADGKSTLRKLERAGSANGKPKRKAVIKKATITVE